MLRRLPPLFGLLTVGLVVWGGYSWLNPAPDLPDFAVEQPDRDLGDYPVGESVLTFRIANQSTQARKILGLAEG